MEQTFQLLLACPSGLKRSQIVVDFSSRYDREPHSDPSLESSIDKIWTARCTTNASLFNASKFRYGGYRAEGTKDALQVCLHLGLTDYKTFVGTNLSPDWRGFTTSASDDVSRCKHTSSPLGNGAIVETVDSRILVLQRSGNVGEFPGHLVFPGGHSEPVEVGIDGHLEEDDPAKQEVFDKIADEMFYGILREVCEETGVPETSLSEAVFIGISRRLVNVRPTAFFYMRCSLSSQEVLEHYRTASDSFESTKLCCFTKEELESRAANMPGCHQGGAGLFKLMIDHRQHTLA